MLKKFSKSYLVVAGVVFVAAMAALNFFVANAQTRERSTPVVAPTPTPLATPPIGTIPPPPPPMVVEDKNDIIKVDTELVNLSVRVVDRNNRPIVNLTQNDFEVREDGVVQPIEFFSKSEVPTDYLLLIDNSGSIRFQLEKVIDASKTIVATNRQDDKTGVIRFVSKNNIELLQDFTSNRQELNDALDNMFIEGGPTAIIDALYLATEKVDSFESDESRVDRKRRAIILVSDGEDRDSYFKEVDLNKKLRESDVQIFSVGFIDELDRDGNFIRKSAADKAKSFLERIASETGGKAYFPSSVAELPQIAKDIANEMRLQYSIGYVPSNDKEDGTYRNIKVVVKNGADNQKRIPIYRTGRTANAQKSDKPRLQSN
ncbi:MAG: VWA domain-containing protein [Pyrinomonadaceae bacterium]